MVEIKPGYELDRAVAEAIGLKATHKVLGGGYYFVRPGDEMEAFPVKFAPSVDLNAAFFAAESVGLFSESYRGICKEPSDDTWGVVDVLSNCERVISSEDTPALAICAAILELAKARGPLLPDVS